MSKFSTFMHLSREQKRALFRILPTMAAVDVGLLVLPLPSLSRLLGVRLITNPRNEEVPASPIELSGSERLEIRAANLLFKNRSEYGRCLRSSLLIARRLRGREPVVRIGVLKDDGAVKAHAWVELSGTSIASLVGYSPLRHAVTP